MSRSREEQAAHDSRWWASGGARQEPGRAWRRRVRRLLLALIALLYVASVPWYRSADDAPRLVFGLPDWVAVALACYVAAAFLNAGAWLLTELHDRPEGAEGGERQGEEPSR
jgi:hypothetical protein